jgi:outer membrane immunogenic protein
VGGTIGYDWGGVRTGERSSFSPGFVTVVAAGEVPASFRLRKTRATGAGEFGYNWEMGGYFLVGLETDFQNGAGDKKTIYLSGAGGTIIDPSTSRAKSRVDWFGTLRGRIGITFCQSLFYITGGYAYGRVHDDVSIFFTPAIAGAFSGKHEQTKNGWTVGGGGEYAFLLMVVGQIRISLCPLRTQCCPFNQSFVSC